MPTEPRDQESRAHPAGEQTSPTPIPRRRFMQAAGVGALGVATGAGARNALAQPGGSRGAPAKNVIVMVSDGMSAGTFTLADMAIRARTGRASNWFQLFSDPSVRRSLGMTHSANSLVTDSAAAGSAWGSGVHVNNGAVNVTPRGATLEPIMVTARRRGMATGLVTTTRVTHATPASFVAGVPKRDLEGPIAQQILSRGVDVVLGGGAKYFPQDLLDTHPDVTTVRTAEALRAAPADDKRLLGLFSDSHLHYVLDRGEETPTLAEMSRVAIDRLRARGDGFLLQIEAGRVDHAAHANDAGALIADQIEFDEALGEVLTFVLGRTDTLLIVTTDHANANPGLTLYGRQGNDAFERLLGARRSFEWLGERFGEIRSADTPASVVQSLMGELNDRVELTQADAQWIVRGLVRRERTDGFLARSNNPLCLLGSVLANSYGVSFLSPNHTADQVEVTAIGPGAERLEPTSDNIDLYSVMTAALGLPAQNQTIDAMGG